MCPPVASPVVADIALDVSDEEVILLLMSIKEGSGLPNNVIRDTNPCLYLPENLPVDIWYLIALQEKKATKHGIWKAKGEACELFSDSDITVWRKTLQFYKGSDERKTDWMMQEYWTTQKGRSESRKPGGANSLCRIFLGDVQDTSHENFSTTETRSRLAPPQDSNVVAFASSSERKTEVEQSVETGRLAIETTHPTVNSPGSGDLAGGDYLELLDLEAPLTPSSSSDNSSCATMSSGEYFDWLDLLRDLETENTDQVETKNEGCRLNVSTTKRAEELFVLPVSPGRCISIEGGVEEIGGNQQLSVNGSENLENIVLQQSVKNVGAENRVEGPSSSSRADKVMPKNIKRKYFCFMPF